MAGAPKGNKNALKHGLYAVRTEIVTIEDPQVRKATFAVAYLQDVIDRLYEQIRTARGEELCRLSNALCLATTALFNGHRTISYLTGGMTPMEEALRELQALEFSED